jgi:hypothetical protein
MAEFISGQKRKRVVIAVLRPFLKGDPEESCILLKELRQRMISLGGSDEEENTELQRLIAAATDGEQLKQMDDCCCSSPRRNVLHSETHSRATRQG